MNGSSVIYNKYMDRMLLLVKSYCITNYLMYSLTVNANVAGFNFNIQNVIYILLNLSPFQYSTWTNFL